MIHQAILLVSVNRTVGEKFGKRIIIASAVIVSSCEPESWARLIPSGGLLLAEASTRCFNKGTKALGTHPRTFGLILVS